MSASTLERPTPASTRRAPGPSMARLTTIELRKFVDTRSGFWLLIVIGALSAVLVAVQLIWGDESSGNYAGFIQQAQFPVAILLPVLGILTVTTEWSQRTALTTFTLVPQRSRILTAKLSAAVVVSLVMTVVTLAFAAVGNLLALGLDRGDGSWSVAGSLLGQVTLLQVLSVVMGVAFGMLLMNTPVAIVTYFVFPTVFSILGATINAIKDVIVWLDLNGAMQPLFDGSMHDKDWQHLATSGLVFIAVPLLLGGARLLRREVK